MENVFVTVSINGSGSSEKRNYGNISYNQLEATIKKKYPRLESFELINSNNIICHPSDDVLNGDNYVVNITTMETAGAAGENDGPVAKKSKLNLITVNKFPRQASECVNTFKKLKDVPDKYVDLDRVVTEMLDIVNNQLPKTSSDYTYRVPPLVEMRFARGGKTTTLTALFEALKAQGTAAIMISFNGSGPRPFKHRDGESQSAAILRLVGAQLCDYNCHDAENLVVDRDALEAHLASIDNVVLLIDELNMLALNLDAEAAALLREMFLDKLGRFLVVTTHYLLALDGNKAMAGDVLGASGSTRGICTVNMSLANTENSLAELKGMSICCEALTPERAAWLGYIPSLVYCTMNDMKVPGALTPRLRFQQMHILVPPDEQPHVLKQFVHELITGDRDPVVEKYYRALQSVGENQKVSYPMCYIREIFGQLRSNEGVPQLLKILDKLESHLDATESGMDWECTVQLAIVLRLLAVHWFGINGPFNLVPVETKPALDFRTIPQELNTVKLASEFMDNILGEYKEPTLIYVDTAFAKFPQVEGFLIYTDGSPTTAKKIGFQMKKGDVKPRDPMDLELVNKGAVLIRGRCTATNPRVPKHGWSYMTTEEVRDFIGNSLLLAMPRDMLAFNFQ